MAVPTPMPATMYPTCETMWYDRMRRALFSMHAYSTPYTAITVPAAARISHPAKPRASTYTAVLVV